MKTFARVWKYAHRYPWYAAGTLLCAILTTLAGFVFPQAAGMVLDRVIQPRREELLFPYVLAVIGSFFIRDGFNSLRIRLNNTFEQRVIFDLRCDLYRALQRLPLRWYDQRATGDLMTRVGEDVMSLERVLIDGIEQGVVAVLQIVGVGAWLFYLNARLALWMLLPMPFLFGGALWYTLTARPRYRLQRKATSAMQALLLDNLQGIRQIKSYAREDQEGKRFARRADEVKEGTLVVMRAWAWYSPAMTFFGAIGGVIVLYIGGLDAIHAAGFSPGQLVTFILYVGMFYDPVGRLHQLNQLLQAGRAAGERVFEIIDAEQEPYERSAGHSGEEADASKRWISPPQVKVVYDNVSFEYRDSLPVLHQIHLTAEAGQTIALVGPSGAGKSTLVNLLPRFYEASGGGISINGRDIRDFSLLELRSLIGVVSQESFLFNGTVLENLKFGRPEATREEVGAAATAANAHGFIAALPEGYDTAVGERGVKLSVGEKQRISIARALLKDPPILILDEATASVDTGTELVIQQALEKLLKGRTSFVIAHRLSTVRAADRIVVLRDGRIIEEGRHEELLERGGLYARLCRVQSGVEPISERSWGLALS